MAGAILEGLHASRFRQESWWPWIFLQTTTAENSTLLPGRVALARKDPVEELRYW